MTKTTQTPLINSRYDPLRDPDAVLADPSTSTDIQVVDLNLAQYANPHDTTTCDWDKCNKIILSSWKELRKHLIQTYNLNARCFSLISKVRCCWDKCRFHGGRSAYSAMSIAKLVRHIQRKHLKAHWMICDICQSELSGGQSRLIAHIESRLPGTQIVGDFYNRFFAKP
ncbi:hypothetical protein CPB84DRAFT_1786743 [Gymnopilus junonius]|uniref:Uncharacterized protein n=1 Tax=Gymnopilus junonius TaxID=109634 RepID=A0A9P5TJ93_GYMJU|nr:hypothetical protein CPB84DRAFT_1786743 [Gymnopilus junonius]